ncbi:MAG TPA: aldo/keto reductase [Granulicella sp.]
MYTRPIGTSDIHVAPLMLGGNVFGWTIDAPTSFAVLDAFVDHGLNFIDTANIYSVWIPGHQGGESESIIGEWFKRSGKRDKVVIATKIGVKMGDGGEGLSKEYILKEVENSLRRLQTDVIDLYQSHTDDEKTPLDETLEAYHQLITQGKVKLIGASNYSGARVAEAMKVAEAKSLTPYQTLQPEYNLYSREKFETDLQPVAEKYGLDVIPYFSLASGFLTGKYKTLEDIKGANREGALAKYFDERGTKILKALEEVSEETGATQAAISLAWLAAQPTILAPIASATSVSQLEDLVKAVELRLPDAALEKLTAASAY